MMFERLFRPKTTRIELDLTDAQIAQLRSVMDNLPLSRYAHLVLAVVKKLPLESDAGTPSGADADLQAAHGPAGSFSLQALTPQGHERMAEIDRLLARLPHTGDL